MHDDAYIGRRSENKLVRPRWLYDMRPSVRAEVFLFWMFARKTGLL